METYLDLTTVVTAQPVLSFRQIAAVRLLQLSSQQLAAAIAHERDTNPALEVAERECCLRCGTALRQSDLQCPVCGHRLAASNETGAPGFEMSDYDSNVTNAGGQFEDDGQDPIMRVSGSPGRAEGLLQALWIVCAEDEKDLAEYLIGSLDSHGYLPATIIEDAALALDCSRSKVQRVLRALQRMEPAGIGARSAQECLLIQLRRLAENGQPHPLAILLVRRHLKALAYRRFREVALAVGVTPKKIEAESDFIRTHLNPYPAHSFDPDFSNLTELAHIVRPDVIIRRGVDGFEAEVVEERRFDLRVSQEYRLARKNAVACGCDANEIAHIRQCLDQAHTFLAALRQRWETMRRVSNALIRLQHDFLEHGPRSLKSLTRADVARTVGLHESTVSRATDGKFVLLPNGRTVPFDDFFDGSLPTKKALIDLIKSENPCQPMSDEQLVHALAGQGIEVARRTIAKYREEIGILPSRLRRIRERSAGLVANPAKGAKSGWAIAIDAPRPAELVPAHAVAYS